jgi:hypothetical protein
LAQVPPKKFDVMGSAWMESVALVGGIALFALVLSVVAVGVRRASDAECLALQTRRILSKCEGLLVGPVDRAAERGPRHL